MFRRINLYERPKSWCLTFITLYRLLIMVLWKCPKKICFFIDFNGFFSFCRLSADARRRKNRLAGETSIWFGSDLIPILLERRVTSIPLCASRINVIDKRFVSRDGHQLVRHRQHATSARHDEILEGQAHNPEKAGKHRVSATPTFPVHELTFDFRKQDVLDEYMERVKRRGHVKQIDPTCLKWSPFVPPTSQSGGWCRKGSSWNQAKKNRGHSWPTWKFVPRAACPSQGRA